MAFLLKPLINLFSIISPDAQQKVQNKSLSDGDANKPDKQLRTQGIDDEVCKSIQDVLLTRSKSVPTKHLLFYPLGSTTSTNPKQVSYGQLYAEAKDNSRKLIDLAGFRHGRPILLYLDNHYVRFRTKTTL